MRHFDRPPGTDPPSLISRHFVPGYFHRVPTGRASFSIDHAELLAHTPLAVARACIALPAGRCRSGVYRPTGMYRLTGPQKFHASLQCVKQEIAQEFDDRRLFVQPGEHIQLNGRKGFQAGYPVIHG